MEDLGAYWLVVLHDKDLLATAIDDAQQSKLPPRFTLRMPRRVRHLMCRLGQRVQRRNIYKPTMEISR
jgi:hypothetical protein